MYRRVQTQSEIPLPVFASAMNSACSWLLWMAMGLTDMSVLVSASYAVNISFRAFVLLDGLIIHTTSTV